MFCTKRYVVWALLSMAALCVSTVLQGQATFNGTWYTDLSKSKFSEKPFTIYTSGGWYHCVSCSTPFDLQADGQDHTSPDKTFDTMSITLVDAHTIHFVGKKGGKVITDTTATVSADGRTTIMKSTSYPANGSAPVTSESTLRRDGTLPAGVHPTSGRWIVTKASASENGSLITYKADGSGITMTDPTGDSYTAKLDGGDAPVSGSTGWDTVSMKQIDDHTIEETDKFNGKVLDTARMTVSANGKTMTVVYTEEPSSRVSTYIATRR
jgi:hypothetical protein